jgi:hypothetical protein
VLGAGSSVRVAERNEGFHSARSDEFPLVPGTTRSVSKIKKQPAELQGSVSRARRLRRGHHPGFTRALWLIIAAFERLERLRELGFPWIAR